MWSRLNLCAVGLVMLGCGGAGHLEQDAALEPDAATSDAGTAASDASTLRDATVTIDAGQGCGTPARMAGALVVTDTGPIQGSVVGASEVFKGIPFAAPPLGPLRWRPPRPATCWQAVRSATSFGSMCMQPDGTGA